MAPFNILSETHIAVSSLPLEVKFFDLISVTMAKMGITVPVSSDAEEELNEAKQ